jgi:hypothetical protein
VPIESAIVLGGIVLAFVLFAVALGWADYYARGHHLPPQ